MAKTIKFNLVCDRTSVRTLEDLQAHFCIEDILAYYKNGILEKWLSVRGFSKEQEAVSAITETQDLPLAETLAGIFGVEIDRNAIQASLYSKERVAEDVERYRRYEEQNYHVEQILSDYESGYRHCIDDILSHRENTGIIRASLNRIYTRYWPSFERDYLNLFFIFAECAPLAVFVMLTDSRIRELALGESPVAASDNLLAEGISEEPEAEKNLDIGSYMRKLPVSLFRLGEDTEEGAEYTDLEEAEKKLQKKKQKAIRELLNRITTEKVLWSLKDAIPHAMGKTKDTFQLVGDADKKYMVIFLGENSTELRRDRRSAKACAVGQRTEALTQSQVAGKFPILEGLEYCGYYADHVLFYLEV